MLVRHTLFACALMSSTQVALADDLIIHVLPKDAAHEAPAGVVRVAKLFMALERAAAHLPKCGSCTVTIRVASGEQIGRAQVGQWTLPTTVAPGATLRILGGYDASMTRRDPLRAPTILVTNERRSGPVFAVESGKSALRELMISGFAFDVAAGNRYDAKSGALMKGGSSSWPILVVGSLTAQRLIIADNIFANAANAVAAPNLRPAGNEAEVIVRNNLFAHNVHCWQVVGMPTKEVLARYLIEGNTFYRNYPYNPDPTTSNPGTLEIGSAGARQVVIRGNLFAHNTGGAIFPQWDERRGPPLSIRGNLFFQNGELFRATNAGQGAVVGKFNGSGTHHAYAPSDLEDDFSWDSGGNVVLDPGIEAVAGGAKPETKAVAAKAGGAAKASADDETADEDGEGAGEETAEEDAAADDDGLPVVNNADVAGFAPRAQLDYRALPMPRAAAAKKFGASPERVVTP